MAKVEPATLDHPSAPPTDTPKSPGEDKTMLDVNSAEPPKKRRRVAKPNADKKFECAHEGCGKSYSRAEHLYRHQLNRKSCRASNGPQANLSSRYTKDHL